jgi:4-amino-4-deoxy-L-arabinose transferase-like glycosyltransferase
MKINLRNRTWIIFAIFILIFITIESGGLNHYDIVDENVYFYAGKLVSEGKVPYRDFFLAHPPMQLYINAAILKILGFNLVALKLVPLLSAVISALFIFMLLKERFGNMEAVLGALLFLFSSIIMREATYALGINLTTMFVIAGFYFVMKNKCLAGGLLFGLAGVSGLYSLIPACVVMIFLFLVKKKNLMRFLIGFCLVFITVNLFFVLIAGQDYIDPVYRYHLLKPKVEGNNLRVFTGVIKANFLLIIGGLLVLFVKNRKKVQLPIFVCLAYVLFLAKVRLFNFYFVLLFGFLSIVAAYSFAEVIRGFRRKVRILLLSTLVILIVVSAVFTTRHLYSIDFVDFQSKDKIVDFIVGNTDSGDIIAGDDQTVSLVALLSGRKTVLELVDSNDMRFRSGITDLGKIIERLRKEKIKYIIIRPLYGIGKLKLFREYLEDDCKLEKWVKDYYQGDFLLYRCSD